MDGLFETVSNHLNQGVKVQVTGFGSFEVKKRRVRTGVKPGTTEKNDIPASKYPAFRAGKSFESKTA